MAFQNTILLATRNRGKIIELSKMLAPFKLTVVGLDAFPQIEEAEENGSSFEENALIKARHASSKSGLVAVADDSGLMVDALGGKPGIYSARYSAENGKEATDESNNAKLLAKLANIPPEQRGAKFCSVIAAVAPNGQSITAKGMWEGIITNFPSGANGFGYDPLFLDPDLGLTAGQMSQAEKNQRSHRAKAMEELAKIWPDFWASVQKD